MERELNKDTIIYRFQGIAYALGMRDYTIATRARIIADTSARFGISLEEAEAIVRWLEAMDISTEKSCALEKIEERKDKRMLEKINYLQVFDQRKKSQVIQRKIRYPKKLP